MFGKALRILRLLKFYDLEKGYPLGTGPYTLAKVEINDSIWVRNDDWWGAKTGFQKLPEAKRVIFSYVGTAEVRIATAMEDGFDAMQDVTAGAFNSLVEKNPSWIAWHDGLPLAWPDPCVRVLMINCAIEPWDDVDMRWVLSDIMDRRQIIDIAYEKTTSYAPYIWPDYQGMKKYSRHGFQRNY